MGRIPSGYFQNADGSLTRDGLELALFVEERIGRLQDYVVRGRSLARVSDGALAERWTEAWLAANVRGDDHRDGELLDLRSEFDLRGIEPPMHALEGQRATRSERALTRRSDSATMEQRHAEELDALRAQLSRPKN